MTGVRRRQFDLYSCTGVSATGEVWLMHNTRMGEAWEGREKLYFKIFLSCLKIWIPFHHERVAVSMSVSSVAQSCLTLCNTMDCSLPGSSVHQILQARIVEWAAISFSRGSSWFRDQTRISCTFWIGRQILYHHGTKDTSHTKGLSITVTSIVSSQNSHPFANSECNLIWKQGLRRYNKVKTRLEWALNPMTGTLIRRGENTWRPREEGHMKTKVEMGSLLLQMTPHPEVTWS